MEIDRTITNIWTITIHEREVFKRVTDESLMNSYQRVSENPKQNDETVITDDDRAFFERYYRAALAELSALLAKRTYRYGGSITNDFFPLFALRRVHRGEGEREVVRTRGRLRERGREAADTPDPPPPPFPLRAADQTFLKYNP